MAKILVKKLNTGETGHLSEEFFDPSKYERVGGATQTQPQTPENKGFRATDLLPIAGGIIGGVGGTLVAPGAGTIVGGGAGSAAGEALRQMLEGEDTNVGKIATEGAFGLIGGPVGKGVGAATKIAGKALTRELPERIMSSVLKEPIRATKSSITKGASLGEEALSRGTKGTTKQIYETSARQIDNTENTLQDILTTSNKTVPIADIRKTVKPLVNEYKQAGNINAANALEQRIAAIEAEAGSSIPAARANQIKRSLYDEAQKAYGTEASAGMEGIKTIARGIKESLEKIPGVKQLNKDLSFYGRQRDSMLDKMTRDERNNILGLTDAILGGAGFAGAGAVGAVPLIVAKKALGTTVAKTTGAQALKKTGEIASKTPLLARDIASQAIGQSLSRTGGSFAMQPSNNTQAYNNQNEGTNTELVHGQTLPQNQQTVKSDNPYPAENYAQDVARDPKNRAAYKAIYDAYQEAYGGGGGLELSDSAIKIVTDLQGASSDIQNLKTSISGSDAVGPISGLRALNPYDASARSLQAEIDRVRQVVGKALEGGVLRKEDEEKYKKILPTMNDTKEVALSKLDQLEKKINEDLARYSGSQQRFGKGRSGENLINTQAAQQALQGF